MSRMQPKRRRGVSLIVPLGVVAGAVVALIAVYFLAVGEVPELAPETTDNVLARDRPTGAGTAPETPADPLVDINSSEPAPAPERVPEGTPAID